MTPDREAAIERLWAQFIDEQPPLTTAFEEYKRACGLGYDAGASASRVEALVEIVRGLIQIYTDLEKDVETDAADRGVEYHHWPMADEMLDKAKAALR